MGLFVAIIKDVLYALYTNFGCALVIALLFMFAYIIFIENGVKSTLKKYIGLFKRDRSFRRVFLLALYTSMILCRTVLCRTYWTPNAFANLIGTWGLYTDEGKLYIENIDNFILFLPFTYLVLWCFRDRLFSQIVTFKKSLVIGTKYAFIFSLVIEFSQLFFKLGEFQLSDLFYNTLGGFIGGLIYWIGYRIQKHNKT